MRVGLRVLLAVLCLAMSALSARAVAQESAPQANQPTITVQGLSPETVNNIIANARPDRPATLTFANRDIAVFRAALLGRSSADRATAARQLLTSLAAENRRLTVTSRGVGAGTVVTVDGRDIIALVPADVDELLGETLQSKTAFAVARVQQALDETLEARRPQALAFGLFQAVLATTVFVLILWLMRRIDRRASSFVEATTAKTLAGSALTDEIVRQTRLVQYIRNAVRLVEILVGLSIAYLWLVFVLRRFPYSRPWGESLRAFLWERLAWLGTSITSAIPGIFTIALVIILTRFAIRIVNLVIAGVEEGRVTIPGIYPETAAPTRKLLIGMLWLFALAVSYPYLPGSDTDAFKGVSVFIGLMVSLGSSGLVNQVMSGLTVTYSRALRRGDFVRVGDTDGTVTHIGTLSTKIETPFGEEVTIPNAVLVSSTVTNFSRNAETVGVYARTSVTIGYDAPWRQVEALLLLAASRTSGVRRDPAPRVLQTGLEDFYVRYTLLVSLEKPNRRGPILAELHANIQDAFNEHGVQIMSPNYEADPEDRKVVPKERWYSSPAAETRAAAEESV